MRPSGGEKKISREDGPYNSTPVVSAADTTCIDGGTLLYYGLRPRPVAVGRAWWLACMAKWHPVPELVASVSAFPTHPTCAQMLRPSTGADCRTRRPQLNERIRKSDSRFRSHSACHLPVFTLAPPFPATARKILQVCNSQSSPLLYWMQIWS